MKRVICEKWALAELTKYCIKVGQRHGKRNIELFTAPNRKRSWISPAPHPSPFTNQTQPGNLKLAIRVLQLKLPVDFKYSVV